MAASQGSLWPDLEADGVDLSNVNRLASALEYVEVWRIESQERHKDTVVTGELRPGKLVATVDSSTNHPRGEEITKDLMRLGMQIHGMPDKWLVRYDTPREAHWIAKFGIPGKPTDAPGETEDSPVDGSGHDASDFEVDPAAGFGAGELASGGR